MYICDLMASLADAVSNPKIAAEIDKIPGKLDIEMLTGFSSKFINDKTIDLFAYDRSALLAAGDMRVDRQNDVEKIAELVFAKPRNVFLECNYADRDAAFSRVKAMPDLGDPMIGKPVRVGNLFNIEGNGKATLRVVWTTPKSEVRNLVPPMLKSSGVAKFAQKSLYNAHTLNVSSHYLEIDTSKQSSLTIEEFSRLVENDPSSKESEIFQYAISSARGEGLNDKQMIKEAYDLYRLNSMATIEFDESNIPRLIEMSNYTGIPPERVLDTLQKDMDGELILGIGMLALLELESLDIKVRQEGRREKTRDRRGRSKNITATKSEFDKPMISVVNMNIGDDLVSALYAQRVGDVPTGSGNRQSPALHAVKGHMFRARNGKIVYRKPHFRGVQSKRSITKVTAQA